MNNNILIDAVQIDCTNPKCNYKSPNSDLSIKNLSSVVQTSTLFLKQDNSTPITTLNNKFYFQVFTELISNLNSQKIDTNNINNIIDSCFDLKSRGDLSQLEFFIHNTKEVYSFETNDTFLLLIAIIRIGYNQHSTNPDNKFISEHPDDRFIMFNTSYKQVPIIYKLSITQIANIYKYICYTIFKSDNYHKESDTHLCFITIARIFDTFHDFGSGTKSVQNLNYDEDIPLLTFIKNFIDYCNYKTGGNKNTSKHKKIFKGGNIYDFFDNSESTKKKLIFEKVTIYNRIYELDTNTTIYSLLQKLSNTQQSDTPMKITSPPSRRSQRIPKPTDEKRAKKDEEKLKEQRAITQKINETKKRNEQKKNVFIFISILEIVKSMSESMSESIFKITENEYIKDKITFLLSKIQCDAKIKLNIQKKIFEQLNTFITQIFNINDKQIYQLLLKLKDSEFETYFTPTNELEDFDTYNTSDKYDTSDKIKDILDKILIQSINIDFSILIHLDTDKKQPLNPFIQFTPTLDFIYNNIKTLSGQKLIIHFDMINLTKTLFNNYQHKSTICFFTDFKNIFEKPDNLDKSKYKKQLRLFGYISDYDVNAKKYSDQNNPLIIGINYHKIKDENYKFCDDYMIPDNSLGEGLFNVTKENIKTTPTFFKFITNKFYIHIDSKQILLDNFFKAKELIKYSPFSFEPVYLETSETDNSKNTFSVSYGIYIIPTEQSHYSLLQYIVDSLYHSRFYCTKYQSTNTIIEHNTQQYKLYTGHTYCSDTTIDNSTIYSLCMDTHYPIFYKPFNYYDYNNGMQLHNFVIYGTPIQIHEFCFQNKLNCNFLIHPSKFSSMLYKEIISNLGILEICNFLYSEINRIFDKSCDISIDLIFNEENKKIKFSDTSSDTRKHKVIEQRKLSISFFKISLILRTFISLHIQKFIEFINKQNSSSDDLLDKLFDELFSNNTTDKKFLDDTDNYSYKLKFSKIFEIIIKTFYSPDIYSQILSKPDFKNLDTLSIDEFITLLFNKQHYLFINNTNTITDTDLDIGCQCWLNSINKYLTQVINICLNDNSHSNLKSNLQNIYNSIVLRETAPYFPLWLNFDEIIKLLIDNKIFNNINSQSSIPSEYTNCKLDINNMDPYDYPHIKFIEKIWPYILFESTQTIVSNETSTLTQKVKEYSKPYDKYNDDNFNDILKSIILKLNQNKTLDEKLQQKSTYINFLDKLTLDILNTKLQSNINFQDLKQVVANHIRNYLTAKIDSKKGSTEFNNLLTKFWKIFDYFTKNKRIQSSITTHQYLNIGTFLTENSSLEDTIRHIIIYLVNSATSTSNGKINKILNSNNILLPDEKEFNSYKTKKKSVNNYKDAKRTLNITGNNDFSKSYCTNKDLKLLLDATNIAQELRTKDNRGSFGNSVASIFDPSSDCFTNNDPILSYNKEMFDYGNDNTMVSNTKLVFVYKKNINELKVQITILSDKTTKGGKRKCIKGGIYNPTKYQSYITSIINKITIDNIINTMYMINLGYSPSYPSIEHYSQEYNLQNQINTQINSIIQTARKRKTEENKRRVVKKFLNNVIHPTNKKRQLSPQKTSPKNEKLPTKMQPSKKLVEPPASKKPKTKSKTQVKPPASKVESHASKVELPASNRRRSMGGIN